MPTENDLRASVYAWVNRRRRGGFKSGEAFTTNEGARAHPAWSRSQVWRVLHHYVRAGLLSTSPDANDGRALRFTPTRDWS